MTQTENYKLNQWERSDRILMEDFNADNARLEAALAGLERRKLEVVELLDVSAELDGAESWKVPMDGVKLGEQFAVFMEIDATMPVYLEMARTTTYFQASEGHTGLLLLPLRRPEFTPVFIPFSRGKDLSCWYGLTYANLEQLTVLPNSGRPSLTGSIRIRITAIP